MPYKIKVYAYILACWFVALVITHWLREYGWPFLLVFVALGPLPAIYFGRWLFGRKNL